MNFDSLPLPTEGNPTRPGRHPMQDARDTRDSLYRGAAVVPENEPGPFGHMPRTVDEAERSIRGGWSVRLIGAEARQRGITAERRLIAVFDVLDELIDGTDFDSRTFLALLADTTSRRGTDGDYSEVVRDLRALIATLAAEAELCDIDGFCRSWSILMHGAISMTADGDAEAAQRARVMATDLVVRHRPLTFIAHPVERFPSDFDVIDFDDYDAEGDVSPAAPASAGHFAYSMLE